MKSSVLHLIAEWARLVDVDAESASVVIGRLPGSDGESVRVSADPANLERALQRAETDVDVLWPGRDLREGAIALLSVALEARICTNPQANEFRFHDDGGWSAFPAMQTKPPFPLTDVQWSAFGMSGDTFPESPEASS